MVVVAPRMPLNKEVVQKVSHSQIAFWLISWWKIVVMPLVRRRNAYQHVSNYDRVWTVVYHNCSLSYHAVAFCVGRDPVTVCRIWN